MKLIQLSPNCRRFEESLDSNCIKSCIRPPTNEWHKTINSDAGIDLFHEEKLPISYFTFHFITSFCSIHSSFTITCLSASFFNFTHENNCSPLQNGTSSLEFDDTSRDCRFQFHNRPFSHLFICTCVCVCVLESVVTTCALFLRILSIGCLFGIWVTNWFMNNWNGIQCS